MNGKLKLFLKQNPVFIIIALLAVIFSILEPTFFTGDNFFILTRQMGVLGFLAFGASYPLMAGEIDLSMEGISALAGCSLALLMPKFGLIFGLTASLVIGILTGLINAYLSIKFKIPTFLITLGTGIFFVGLSFILTNYRVIAIMNDQFFSIFSGDIFRIPKITLWYIAGCIIFYLSIHKTRYGKRLLLTGGDEESAMLSGINTQKIKIAAFMISGISAAFGGILFGARMGAARAEMSEGFLLPGIASPVIGGTSLFGGRGKVYGTIAGVLLLTMILNGLTLKGMPEGVRTAVEGLVIVFAVILSERIHLIKIIRE